MTTAQIDVILPPPPQAAGGRDAPPPSDLLDATVTDPAPSQNGDPIYVLIDGGRAGPLAGVGGPVLVLKQRVYVQRSRRGALVLVAREPA